MSRQSEGRKGVSVSTVSTSFKISKYQSQENIDIVSPRCKVRYLPLR